MDNEPFSGVNGRTSIFDWWTVASLQRLHQWIRDRRTGLTPGEKAVLKRYQELLTLAKDPVFAQGKTFDLCYCQQAGHFNPDRHFAFLRSNGSRTVLVIANFGEDADISVRIPTEALDYLKIKAVRTVYTETVKGKDYSIINVE